jgi:hypothetical protein
MIRCVITTSGKYLGSPDLKEPFSDNGNKCIGFPTVYEGIPTINFLNEELPDRIFCLRDIEVIEIENKFENIILGTISDTPFFVFGERYYFMGIPKREYNIESLRGGDGC